MIDRPFIEQFPRPLPRDPDALFSKWAQAHQDSFDQFDRSIEEVAATHRISEAEGEDLDRVGEQFGRIGRRRGRGDREYRSFLLSIVPSFKGRGTPTGLSFAIGAGVRAEPGEVYIEEHFDDIAYSVEIGDWVDHRVSTVHELADLADPSGVELRTPVKYRYERSGIGLSGSNTQRQRAITAPPATLGVRAFDSTVSYRGGDAFGQGRFDGEDPFGSDFDPERDSSGGGTTGQASFGQSSFGGSGPDEEDGGDVEVPYFRDISAHWDFSRVSDNDGLVYETVEDTSDNGHVLTSNGVVHSTNAINGRDAAYFDGDASFFGPNASDVDIGTDQAIASVYVVWQSTDASNVGYTISQTPNGSQSLHGYSQLFLGSDSEYRLTVGGESVGSSEVMNGGVNITATLFDRPSGEAEGYWNETSEQFTPGAESDGIEMAIGARNQSGTPQAHFAGYIGEVLIYDRRLDATEHESVMAYLGRWQEDVT